LNNISQYYCFYFLSNNCSLGEQNRLLLKIFLKNLTGSVYIYFYVPTYPCMYLITNQNVLVMFNQNAITEYSDENRTKTNNSVSIETKYIEGNAKIHVCLASN